MEVDTRMQGYLKKKNLRSGEWVTFWVEHDIIHDDINYYTENPSLGPHLSLLRGHFSLDGASFQAGLSKNNVPKITIQRRSGVPVKWVAPSLEEAEAWVRHLKSSRELPKNVPQLLSEWKRNKDAVKCIAKNEEDLDLLVKKEYSTAVDFDDDDFDPSLDLPGLVVMDIEGKRVNIDSFADRRITVLFMIRNFGCVMSRVLVPKILASAETFESVGVQLVAVGAGSLENALKWKKETGFPGSVYLDNDNVLPKTFSCKRGFKYMLSPRSLSAIQKALNDGYRPGILEGDLAYLGGVVVYSKRNGIIFQHIEQNLGDQVDVSQVVRSVWRFQRDHPDATWGTPSGMDFGVFITQAAAVADGTVKPFHFERGTKLINNDDLPRLLDFDFYTRLVQHTEHGVWIRKLPEDFNLDDSTDPLGPVVITISKESNGDWTCLILTKSGMRRRQVAAFRSLNEKDCVKFLAADLSQQAINAAAIANAKDSAAQVVANPVKMKKITNSNTLRGDLLKFEAQEHMAGYKFGILLARAGDVTEEDMYSGSSMTTPLFESFINSLGEKVELSGRQGYLGGLDNKGGRTGSHSIFTTFDDANVMFHVSTMIPSTANEHIIAQKRHLGNDMGLIVFKEGPEQIDISAFRSQFNHFFIVVRPVQVTVEANPNDSDEEGVIQSQFKTKYSLEVVCKTGVPPAPPFLPDPPLFDLGPYLRQFIIAKLLNLERMTTDSVPIFRGKMEKVRAQSLWDMTLIANGKKVGEQAPPVEPEQLASPPMVRRGSAAPKRILIEPKNTPSPDKRTASQSPIPAFNKKEEAITGKTKKDKEKDKEKDKDKEKEKDKDKKKEKDKRTRSYSSFDTDTSRLSRSGSSERMVLKQSLESFGSDSDTSSHGQLTSSSPGWFSKGKSKNSDKKAVVFSIDTSNPSSPRHASNPQPLSPRSPTSSTDDRAYYTDPEEKPEILRRPTAEIVDPVVAMRPQRNAPKPKVTPVSTPPKVSRSFSTKVMPTSPPPVPVIPDFNQSTPTKPTVSPSPNPTTRQLPEPPKVSTSSTPVNGVKPQPPSNNQTNTNGPPLPKPVHGFVKRPAPMAAKEPRVKSSGYDSQTLEAIFAQQDIDRSVHKAQFESVRAKWDKITTPEPAAPPPQRKLTSHKSLANLGFRGKSSVSAPGTPASSSK